MAVKKRKPAAETDRATPRRRRRLVEAMLVFVAVLFLIDALVGENGLVAMAKARNESRALQRELAAKLAENVRLREEVQRLQTDPAAIEEVARRELGLIKPGEMVFTIKDMPPPDGQR